MLQIYLPIQNILFAGQNENAHVVSRLQGTQATPQPFTPAIRGNSKKYYIIY